MTSLFALLLMGAVDTAEAHPRHVHRPKHRHAQRHRPAPPPRVHGHQVRWHRNHWVYAHSNPNFIWRWVPGHYTRRGAWVPGSWQVVVRF